ncbi:MAG: helical backbone metal receptor [Alphaproteobacteria bacterium]
MPIASLPAQPGATTLAGHPPTDWAGRRFDPAGGGARIISLVPSITELLFDLGLARQIVGRTHYCIHPRKQVAAIPSVGGTKKIVMDRLKALAPTHVIVNVDENPKEMADAIADLGIAVVVTHPAAPHDNIPLYRLMGHLFGRQREADALCTRLSAALDDLARTAADWPRRRVLYLIWRDPWMTISPDTYIARMLALVNWQTIGDHTSLRYPEITIDQGLLDCLDLVLFASEPFPFKAADVRSFGASFPGSRPARILIDGEMVSWYGSRAIQGLSYLKALAGQFL